MNINDQVRDAKADYLSDEKYLTVSHTHEAKSQLLTGYKQTEVGIIPIDWEVEKIGSLLSITTGDKNTQDRVIDGLYPFFVRSQTIERINTYSFDGEAVLTAGDGVGTGKIFHYINGKFDFHQRVYLMHDFGQKLDGYYFYIIFSNHFYDRIMSMTAKSSVDSVRREMIADMAIALPPKLEQTSIANVLSDVDALIDSLESLIAKKQAIKTATIQQLLTGRTRLPQFARRANGTIKSTKYSEFGEIPEDWEILQLDKCLEIAATYGVVTAGEFQNNGVLMIRGGDIKNGGLNGESPFISQSKSEEYSRTVLKLNDIVIALVGYPGEAARINDLYVGANISRAVGLIRIKKYFDPSFIVHYLNSEIGRKNFLTPSAGSAQIVVNLVDLNKLKVPKPSIQEQKEISSVITDINVQIEMLEKRLVKTCQLKQGMMQELLTGRTRLVESEAIVD